MGKSLLISFLFLLFSTSFFAQVDDIQNYKMQKVPVDQEIHFIPIKEGVSTHYVPYKFKRDKNTERSITFNITYEGNVPLEAQQAMDNAITPILEDIFDSPIPINIRVSFEDLAGSSLAGASPTGYFSNFRNAQKLDVAYAVALAEKIARFPINSPDEPDLTITVNTNANWYYNFSNPSGVGSQFDFVSIILHEILHGLGFSALTFVQDNMGYVKIFTNDVGSIYSDNLYSADGIKLTDLPEGSQLLADELTGGDLFFKSISQGNDYKVYAPEEFTTGSSISHLDELTYSNSPSSLMTPFAVRGAVERDPGVATDMMYEMGWSMTYMEHFPLNLTEEMPNDENAILGVNVISDAGYDTTSLMMHYSFDNFVTEDIAVPLIHVEADSFYAEIPAPGMDVTARYFFEVEDNNDRMFTNPGSNRSGLQTAFNYVFGADPFLPVIDHEPIKSVSESDIGLEVVADISDNFTGIEKAYLDWKLNGVKQDSVFMELDTLNGFSDISYKGFIQFPNGPLTQDDEVGYKIIAIDKSSISNKATDPPRQLFHPVVVTQTFDPLKVYINNFDEPTEHFDGDFEIRNNPGFTSPAIHSPHPYEASGTDATTDYVYQLKFPVIVSDDYPIIEFDEIVLVEPGEPGTVWGQTEFWDYVIVEAKKFGTSAWKPLVSGYDSRANPIWASTYNNGIPAGGQDSNASGAPNLYVNKQIDITQSGAFVAGDTITVRFRLFSDPFAVGWGWAIDDLKIQELSTAVKELSEEKIKIYPNPVGNEKLNIDFTSTDISDGRVMLRTLEGRLLEYLSIVDRNMTLNLPEIPGTYILQVVTKEGNITKKILKL